MQMNRRAFLGTTLAAGAAAATRGFGACPCGCGCGQPAQVAVQLYSIHKYIKGKDGLAKALQEVAKIGYKGVEFAGYYGASADELKKMLADAGLVACGTHVGRAEFGPDKIKATCEFNLAYGNSFICCPGGGNFPGKGENLDDFMKMLVDYYNTAAETAATYGCKIGLHNHKGESSSSVSSPTGRPTGTTSSRRRPTTCAWSRTWVGRRPPAATRASSTRSTRTARPRSTRRRTAWARRSSTRSSASPATAPWAWRGTVCSP